MNNENKDIWFYLKEAIEYYKNVRDRVSGVDREIIRRIDEENIEDVGELQYVEVLRSSQSIQMIKGEINFGKDFNRKLGIIIPKWIELFENIIDEVKNFWINFCNFLRLKELVILTLINCQV